MVSLDMRILGMFLDVCGLSHCLPLLELHCTVAVSNVALKQVNKK